MLDREAHQKEMVLTVTQFGNSPAEYSKWISCLLKWT